MKRFEIITESDARVLDRGETVMLALDSGLYHSLDGVAARIWELLETPATAEEMARVIAGQYGVPVEQCEADILEFFQDLVKPLNDRHRHVHCRPLTHRIHLPLQSLSRAEAEIKVNTSPGTGRSRRGGGDGRW